MRKYLLVVVAITCFHSLFGQFSKLQIDSLRLIHINELKDPEGVLNEEEIKEFGGLNYFEFDAKYQIEARFIKKKGRKFEMQTSTDRKPIYRRYGYVEFEWNGKSCRLEVYQNIALLKNKEYKDYLFIPFRDLTSAKETYGGGRYLDIVKSNSGQMLIDFNLAYNPYCAYSYRYSCPIPPQENTLEIEIRAGEKTPSGH